MSKENIGILGGSFDPVHRGHIGLAKDAMQQAGLERVVFVPVRLQPFKLDKRTASGEDRVNMIASAIENVKGMEMSRYELDAEGISYTYLTMRAMRARFGKDAALYFITGTDSFLQIEKWKNSRELLTEYSFVVGTRPGYREDELAHHAERIRRVYQTQVINIANTQIDVSSTEIRERIRKGESAVDLIPPQVERYITEHGLYR